MSSETLPAAQTALTYKERRIVQGIIGGLSERQAIKAAGFSEAMASHPSWIITNEMRQLVEEGNRALTLRAYENGLISATEIHEYLTDAIRADWCDIENDDGTYRPISEWPLIWRQMKEAGDIEVEYESHRSHDGEDKQGLGGWDQDGIVRKVKIKFASRVKLIELAMKHKGVDAMAAQRQDVDVHVHGQVTAKLQAALARESKIIDVTPEK